MNETGGVVIGFSWECSVWRMHILAPVFLLLLVRTISTLTVVEDLTLIFRLRFADCSCTPLQGRGQ